MHRLIVLVLAVATASVCTGLLPAAAETGPVAVEYWPPVDVPLVDRFRPPATTYGRGNLGVDYATTPGTPAGAAAPGQVVFAGRVGSGLHVVVLHADGVRTSYSFLASVDVRRGQQVTTGETVGATGALLHLGARVGDAYLDPLVLLGGDRPVEVRLVPDVERGMGSESAERTGLRRLLDALPGAAAVRVGVSAVGWARDGVAAVGTGVVTSIEEATAVLAAVVPFGGRPWSSLADWLDSRSRCTPAGVAVAPVPGRRRVVLVAGLGSTSGPAGIDGVDTAALGYDPRDVVRFSYRGGTTGEAPYGASDTQIDINESGRRLRELLERVVSADPGVPVDLIAHSQGGVVARSALGSRAPPGVENLITLGTPHQGADLATALDLTGRTPKGAMVQEVVSLLGMGGIDLSSTSVRQLSEVSGFLRTLNARPLPEGVRITSIAARSDIVVPAPRSHLRGATNVVVTVKGLHEHPLLPAAPAATREMTLALARMAPTCEGLGDVLSDLVAGEAIGAAEDAAGLALLVAAR